jgi:hypothetical protein
LTTLLRHQGNSRHRHASHQHRRPPKYLLLPSIPSALILVPPARARVARSVTLATHRLHPLIATKVFSRRCGCRTNLTKKTARSLHGAPSLPSPYNDCLSAAYVWKRCPMIQSLVPILVDMPSAANAFVDTSPPALMNIDSLYYAPLVLRVKAKKKKQPAVRVATGRSTWLSSHAMSP